MNCNDVRENLIELLAEGQADPSVATHVKECASCARDLESLRQTMAVLDEWETPEPSPYFLTRLQAHVRDDQGKQPEGWLVWLRQPWLAAALATVLVVGSGVYLVVGPHENPPGSEVSAVNDLESLDKNHDLYVNSGLLDELSGAAPDDVTD
ncbi:MAG TPA: hypothetical protein VKY85_20050 [Candidatus Angelobacter sp.]|nr:hypothetical protein [Candidatus Angelobacter sp.]